jgi:hypothetical protein
MPGEEHAGNPPAATQGDRIPSARADEAWVKSTIADVIRHAETRKYIKEIVDDVTGSVDFMKRVREYAGMEIDARIFTSWKFYLTAFTTAVLSSVVGVLITNWLARP